MSKRYSYEVADVGMWQGVVVNEDNEPVSDVMDHEAACELRWSLLTQEERDELILICEVAAEMMLEDRANRELSYIN